MTFPNGITITVITTTRDRHGDRTSGAEFTISGCAFAYDDPAEDSFLQEHVTRTGTLYLPPGSASVTAEHKVRTPDGTVWDVDGGQVPWASPFTGWVPGSTVRLRNVRG